MKTLTHQRPFKGDLDKDWISSSAAEFNDDKYWFLWWTKYSTDSPVLDEPTFLKLVKSRTSEQNYGSQEYQELTQQIIRFSRQGVNRRRLTGSFLTVARQRENFVKDLNIDVLMESFRSRRDNRAFNFFYGDKGTHRVNNMIVRGNATYERKVKKRSKIAEHLEIFIDPPGDSSTTTNALLMGVTLKPPYRGVQSWYQWRVRWNRFMANLRSNFGDIIQTWGKHAHQDGSVHKHVMLIFLEHEFETFWYDHPREPRYLIKNRDSIRRHWRYGSIDIRSVQIQYMRDVEYMVHYFGAGYQEYNENMDSAAIYEVRKAELGMALASVTGSRQYHFPSKSYLKRMAKKHSKTPVRHNLRRSVARSRGISGLRLDTVNMQLKVLFGPEPIISPDAEIFRMVGVSSSPIFDIRKNYEAFYPDTISSYREPDSIPDDWDDLEKLPPPIIRRFTHGSTARQRERYERLKRDSKCPKAYKTLLRKLQQDGRLTYG